MSKATEITSKQIMRSRQDIEELEDANLAPYAMKAKHSRNRVHKEAQHDVRTCYQRDRDRIVHCEHFRKLEYKTQVFAIFEGDYYRTRLTHTIEVAQIARTIGRNLRLNEDLIEAIALAHDLGHPPFGHAGEDILNELMGGSREAIKFNHNKRSFDIVTRFEKRYPDFDGLNLTIEVLIGILKHETHYDIAGDYKNGDFENEGPVLEAKVVDVADSLAYLSHDIDDGLTSGCITENDLKDSRLWQKAYQRIDAKIGTQDREMFKYQIVKALIDMQMRDLLSFSSQTLSTHQFKSSDEVKDFTKNHPKEILIGFSDEMFKERSALQKLLFDRFYNHHRVLRMANKAKRIITDLFTVYKKDAKQIPEGLYRRDHRLKGPEDNDFICNCIASMTDRFAIDEHKKLFDPYEKV